MSNSHDILTTSIFVPKNSPECRASIVAVPTRPYTRFWMSQASALKSGMWPGLSLLMSSLDASLADIIFGGGGGGGGGGGRRGGLHPFCHELLLVLFGGTISSTSE